MSDTRRRIREHVEAHPGVHFSALRRRLDLAVGQLQYHLRRLRREEAVVEETVYGRTHYYPPAWDARERGALALLRRETARDVVLSLVRGGPASPADLAAELDVARSTVEYHLDHLVERDLVRRRREGGRVTVVLARPRETARLLEAVEPSLPARFVDRFERLVDRLLEGQPKSP